MSETNRLSVPLSRRETIAGFVWLVLQMFVMPTLLGWADASMGYSLSEAEFNFLYFLLNFLATLLIFHEFLSQNLRKAAQHPVWLCQAVVLGLAGYYVCNFCTGTLIILLDPDYANYNDQAIASMSQGFDFLMLIGTVVLVPPFEECMFRGLIFRNLWGKSRWLAHLASIVLFALVHLVSYIGIYTPLELALAMLQYLPAGLCLAWSYAKADTIFAPILMHAAVNYISINLLR